MFKDRLVKKMVQKNLYIVICFPVTQQICVSCYFRNITLLSTGTKVSYKINARRIFYSFRS